MYIYLDTTTLYLSIQILFFSYFTYFLAKTEGTYFDKISTNSPL